MWPTIGHGARFLLWDEYDQLWTGRAYMCGNILLWWLTIGFSLTDSRFFWWIGLNAIVLITLQPPLMRISRTVWLSFFVRYSPNWKEGDIVQQYSVNKEQQNNW